MITVYELESRVFGFFDKIFSGDQVSFGLSNSSCAAFIVDRQTEAPRTFNESILYYRVNDVSPIGNYISVDEVKINPSTGLEYIETLRKVHVVVNILSKSKGMAKTAMNFIIAANQTSRKLDACYSDDFDFELPLYNIDRNIRDLTELENKAWTERVEADFYFNYKDVIDFDTQPLINTPSSVEDVSNIVHFEIDLKEEG